MKHLVLIILAAAPLARAASLPPEETVRGMKAVDGLEVTLAAAEPMVRQPVNISFDERGRMWVVQYLQYPDPAGLKPVSVDQYLRTKYDRVPEPPPNGPKGKDRITILEDTDGDGRYDKSKDFVTGLNLATSVEVGHGGVWVTQTPYLLFYADKDRDDVPDGDPRVVLSGFGMEDAHAVVNHLTWGPDGWLYGAQGSTCTANVRGHEFQQAAWRYNPATDEFEVFSEGGGNTFGLEWDAHGNLLTGTNYSNYVMVHYVQGGYFIKGFAKHGPLSNPYSFGYFDHVPHTGWRGGHVTQLGVIYQGGALPAKFNGRWIAPNLLANNIDYHAVQPAGSTFTTKLEGEFLSSADKNFRPVDIRTGPDGAIYVADWYDTRANHVIPQDTWDKATGRVYRIAPRGLPGAKPMDLVKLSGEELITKLDHPNDWYARMARRVLAERRDASLVPKLLERVRKLRDRAAVQSLWALNASGGFNESIASELLNHPTDDVRAWTVRLLGDNKTVTESTATQLAKIAAAEPAAVVRAQLACSARRLPADQALPIVGALMRRPEDVNDRYVPLLLWWAIETKIAEDARTVLELFLGDRGAWSSPLVRQHLLERLARRMIVPRDTSAFTACALLLEAAPKREDLDRLVAGIEKGLAGTALDAVPAPMTRVLAGLWSRQPRTATVLRLALRLGLPAARAEAADRAGVKGIPLSDRVALIEAMGDVRRSELLPALVECLGDSQPKEVRVAAMTALQQYDDPAVPQAVLRQYPQMPPELRSVALTLLASRASWASTLLSAVESGAVKKDEMPMEQVRRMALHGDAALDAQVSRLWATTRRDTPAEKLASVGRWRAVLAEVPGDAAKGKPVFAAACGTCHALHGEGTRIGPDLTGYDRKDLDFLLQSMVDPSAAIRPEFAAYVVETTDGRLFNGPVVASGAETVTVEDGQAKFTVARPQIKRMKESPVSRMPEGLLDGLSPQQVRDLFAYLATDEPQARQQ